MKWLVIFVAAGSFAFAANASAVELVNPDGTRAEPFQTWAERAGVKLDVRIEVRYWDGACGNRADRAGCANRGGWIGLEADVCARRGWRLCRWILLHEIGHHADFNLPPETRLRLPSLGVEEFADTYAHCHLGSRVVYRRTRRGSDWLQQNALPRRAFLTFCREVG